MGSRQPVESPIIHLNGALPLSAETYSFIKAATTRALPGGENASHPSSEEAGFRPRGVKITPQISFPLMCPLSRPVDGSSEQVHQAVRLAAKSIGAETSFLVTLSGETMTLTTGLGTCDDWVLNFVEDVSNHTPNGWAPGRVLSYPSSGGSILTTVDIWHGEVFLGLLGTRRKGTVPLNSSQKYVLKAIAFELAEQLEAHRIGAAPVNAASQIDLITRLRLLESVVVNANDAILITEAEPVDMPGPCILYANPAFTRTTGYTLADVVGKSPRLLQGPLSGTEVPAIIHAALKAWEPVVVELVNYRKDGSTFWVELSISPVCDATGWFTHWVSVQRDVTERKALEAFPGLSTFPIRLLLLAIESVHTEDYLTQSLGQGYVIQTVHTCTELLEAVTTSAPEVILLDVVLPHVEATSMILNLNSDPVTSSIPIVIIAASKDEVSRVTALEAGATDYLIKPFSPKEVQMRIRAQVELQHLRRELLANQAVIRNAETLRQSEKLAVVGRLASSIAHEINNPLEAVTNLLYLAERTLPDCEAGDYVRQAQAEVVRISHITIQTLKFHKQSTAACPTDLEEILDGVLLLFKPKLDVAGLIIDRRYSPVPSVLAFEADLRQVFANLVSNAIDASTPGGHLWLRVRQQSGTNSISGIRITIADNGAGMSDVTREKIFDAFFTTKEMQGTGLGLWVSAGILKAHNAKIRVKSSQQVATHGTVFSIFLPHHALPSATRETSKMSAL